jgi:hypothetical protein
VEVNWHEGGGKDAGLEIGEGGDFGDAEKSPIGGDEGEAEDFGGGDQEAVGGILMRNLYLS